MDRKSDLSIQSVERFIGRLTSKRLAATSAFMVRALVGWSMGQPILLPDSPMYIRIPGKGTFDQVSFLGHLPRPWVITLPFAITGTTNWLVLFNVFFGSFAWIVLLLSVWNLNFSNPLFRKISVLLIALLSCCEAALAWDRFAQSDSIALSGCILVAGGFINLVALRRVRNLDLGIVALGTIVGGLIRPGIGFLILGYFILAIYFHRKQGHHLVHSLVVGFCILLPLFYVGVVNQNLDFAWGKAFKGNQELNGRTLQQIAVINSTSYGAVFVREIVADIAGETSCEYKYLSEPIVNGDAMAWWLHMYETCPGTEKVSREFNSRFAISLLSHPKTSWNYVRVPIAQANQVGMLDNQVVSLVPPILQDTLFGLPGRGFISPVAYWIMFSALAILAVRRRKRVSFQFWSLILASCLLFVGLIFSVVFSPIDTSRIAQPFFMLSTIFAMLAVIGGLDVLLRTSRTQL